MNSIYYVIRVSILYHMIFIVFPEYILDLKMDLKMIEAKSHEGRTLQLRNTCQCFMQCLKAQDKHVQDLDALGSYSPEAGQ